MAFLSFLLRRKGRAERASAGLVTGAFSTVVRLAGLPKGLASVEVITMPADKQGLRKLHACITLHRWEPRLVQSLPHVESLLRLQLQQGKGSEVAWLHGVSWSFPQDVKEQVAELPRPSSWQSLDAANNDTCPPGWLPTLTAFQARDTIQLDPKSARVPSRRTV